MYSKTGDKGERGSISRKDGAHSGNALRGNYLSGGKSGPVGGPTRDFKVRIITGQRALSKQITRPIHVVYKHSLRQIIDAVQRRQPILPQRAVTLIAEYAGVPKR